MVSSSSVAIPRVSISQVEPLPGSVTGSEPAVSLPEERSGVAHLVQNEGNQDGKGRNRGAEKFLANRVGFVVLHIPWYGFRPQARLALDSGVSASAISRLIRGKSQPSLAVALRVTRALSRRLGQPLDIFEVFSTDGHYPTPSVCVLTGCRSCLPPDAYDGEENLKGEYSGIGAGQWSLSPLDQERVLSRDTTSQPF